MLKIGDLIDPNLGWQGDPNSSSLCHQPVKAGFTETPNSMKSPIIAHNESNPERKYDTVPGLQIRNGT